MSPETLEARAWENDVSGFRGPWCTTSMHDAPESTVTLGVEKIFNSRHQRSGLDTDWYSDITNLDVARLGM